MNIFSHQLFRKVLVVASGTAGAQLIAFLFVPIITRIYGPEIYGEFGTFLSVINIILPAVTLGYSSAIVMPRTLREASSVIHLSLIIAFILSLVCYVIIVISKSFFNFNNLLSLFSKQNAKYKNRICRFFDFKIFSFRKCYDEWCSFSI